VDFTDGGSGLFESCICDGAGGLIPRGAVSNPTALSRGALAGVPVAWIRPVVLVAIVGFGPWPGRHLDGSMFSGSGVVVLIGVGLLK
jgi:hypothetical protein